MVGEASPRIHHCICDIIKFSSWLRNQINFTKEAHSSAAILIHLPINTDAFLIQKHTKATMFLAFSFSPLVHCFSKFFGKKNRFLQTRAYLGEVSILTSQGRSFEVIQAPGSLLYVEEHHCCSHFGAFAVGGPWSDSGGFKPSQSSRHTPQVVVKLTRWLQLICNSGFNKLHVHLKLKSREVHRAIQKDSGYNKHPVSIIESQGSY